MSARQPATDVLVCPADKHQLTLVALDKVNDMARNRKSMKNHSQFSQGSSIHLLLFSCCTALFLLNGCGVGTLNTTSEGNLELIGVVHGGQQPVVNSTIQLYAVGSTGNGSAATPMLTRAITSDRNGSFSISGDYSCGSSSSGGLISGSNQVYIVASGGNPGLAQGTNNQALALVAALGPCSNLSSATSIDIDEVTTAAAAWGLTQFATSPTNIGATATNSLGIADAFLDAGLLANTSTGVATTLSSNLSIETAKLYSLADIIATCVNSDGTTACSPLFAAATPYGGTTPTDTFTAALNIVRNPGQNITQIFDLLNPQAPFQPTLSAAPNDWTMSLTVSGGGLASPTAIGVDSVNNVWVVGQSGPLSGFTPQGTPLSPNGFGAGDISQSYGLAIDSLGDIWVTNYNTAYNGAGAVTKFLGSNSSTPGSVDKNNGHPGFWDSSLRYPYAVSADTNGDIFIANNDSSSATVYDSNGNLVSPALGASAGIDAFPVGIAVDSSHGFWLADSDDTIAHFSSNGTLLSHPSCCTLSSGVATDALGNVWVADYLGGPNRNGAFAVVKADGTILISYSNVGGIYYPEGVAIDAAQNVWFTNFQSNTITEIAGYAGSAKPGSALSPGIPLYGVSVSGYGGYGLDAGLSSPFGLAPDRSGNLWVSNEGKAAITMFFGIATPTTTPVQSIPVAP